jgi:hypothetical protein
MLALLLLLIGLISLHTAVCLLHSRATAGLTRGTGQPLIAIQVAACCPTCRPLPLLLPLLLLLLLLAACSS